MSISQLLAAAYAWADLNSVNILAASIAIPLLGTLAAMIGKAGRTDRDGRAIASALVVVGLAAFGLAGVGFLIAKVGFRADLLRVNVLLAVAPLLCLAGCVAGARWVFPLTELASVKTLVDVGLFLGACVVVLWLFSKFRGWGILFFGDLGQLAVILILGYLLLRRLYRRAFAR